MLRRSLPETSIHAPDLGACLGRGGPGSKTDDAPGHTGPTEGAKPEVGLPEGILQTSTSRAVLSEPDFFPKKGHCAWNVGAAS